MTARETLQSEVIVLLGLGVAALAVASIMLQRQLNALRAAILRFTATVTPELVGRPRCLCGHVDRLHIKWISYRAGADTGEPGGSCTARACTCTGFIEAGT